MMKFIKKGSQMDLKWTKSGPKYIKNRQRMDKSVSQNKPKIDTYQRI